MNIAFPSNLLPFVDAARRITEPWQLFLASLVALPGPVADVTVAASPFAYMPPGAGTVYVVGGTVSAIHILRGTVDVNTGQIAGGFALGQKDTLVVTWSVAPTMTFLPG